MTSGPRDDQPRPPAEPSGDRPSWNRLPRRTLAQEAIEAIVSAAARGVILPGDRIVEGEVARTLGISRIPVREALRALETQGVVASEPHRGFRLTAFTQERLHQLLEVRLALEVLAARRAVVAGRHRSAVTDALAAAIETMMTAAASGDTYTLARADTEFHRAWCRAGGNEVATAMWEGLSRQLTIIFGLCALANSADRILEQHRRLAGVLVAADAGDPASMARLDAAIREHIVTQVEGHDLDGMIAARRAEREPSRPPRPRRPGPSSGGLAA